MTDQSVADAAAHVPPQRTAIGQSLRRLGHVAFWAQIFVGLIPVVIITVAFSSVYGVQNPTRTAGIMGLVSLLSFLILIATIIWSRRYIRVGRGITEGKAPDTRKLGRMIWIGLALTAAGIVLSMSVLLVEVTYLLIRFLEAPQGGVPVIQTTNGSGTTWISAVDILGLMTVVLTLASEIIMLVVGLWLLSRVSLSDARART